MRLTRKKAKIEDLRQFKELIKHSGSLCSLTGKYESEVMIGQTVHAAVNNFEEHGEAFSIKDIAKGHIDNYSAYKAYKWLIDNEYFLEEQKDDKTVIFPTQRLMHKLADYFNVQSKN